MVCPASLFFLSQNIEQHGSTTYLLHKIQMLLYFIQQLTCKSTHLQTICSRHDRTDGSIFASLKKHEKTNVKKRRCKNDEEKQFRSMV